MEFGAVPADAEVFVYFFVGLEDFGSVTGFDGVGLDEIGVDNVKNTI